MKVDWGNGETSSTGGQYTTQVIRKDICKRCEILFKVQFNKGRSGLEIWMMRL